MRNIWHVLNRTPGDQRSRISYCPQARVKDMICTDGDYTNTFLKLEMLTLKALEIYLMITSDEVLSAFDHS